MFENILFLLCERTPSRLLVEASEISFVFYSLVLRQRLSHDKSRRLHCGPTLTPTSVRLVGYYKSCCLLFSPILKRTLDAASNREKKKRISSPKFLFSLTTCYPVQPKKASCFHFSTCFAPVELQTLNVKPDKTTALSLPA
ncbi:hypothetical protein PoB_002745900 [Plakobranchus ocellatus]|uniref:Uncharacterized protein n=1 Tax=Plakobranchus ocellatus TaxID=259542 RepID=A0AAV4A2W9_9GAST|nr:hypothetical protein PoB_002745900 [Plakobranchus ocellatus]